MWDGFDLNEAAAGAAALAHVRCKNRVSEQQHDAVVCVTLWQVSSRCR